MSHNHTHSCTCSHSSVKFCKHCNTCYCLDCNQEWPTKSYSYWPYQYPCTYTYENNQLGNTNVQQAGMTQTVGLATSCKHEA